VTISAIKVAQAQLNANTKAKALEAAILVAKANQAAVLRSQFVLSPVEIA